MYNLLNADLISVTIPNFELCLYPLYTTYIIST